MIDEQLRLGQQVYIKDYIGMYKKEVCTLEVRMILHLLKKKEKRMILQ